MESERPRRLPRHKRHVEHHLLRLLDAAHVGAVGRAAVLGVRGLSGVEHAGVDASGDRGERGGWLDRLLLKCHPLHSGRSLLSVTALRVLVGALAGSHGVALAALAAGAARSTVDGGGAHVISGVHVRHRLFRQNIARQTRHNRYRINNNRHMHRWLVRNVRPAAATEGVRHPVRVQAADGLRYAVHSEDIAQNTSSTRRDLVGSEILYLLSKFAYNLQRKKKRK